MTWATSTRRARLPRDWAKRVATVKRRARGQCQAETHEPECDGIGAQCDHMMPGDNHSLRNLQWLSEPCHRAKTQRESQSARGVGAGRLRSPARHPSER